MKVKVIDNNEMLKNRGFTINKEYEVIDKVYLNNKVFLYIVKNDEGKIIDIYPKSVKII